ncbi:protein-L-isoaspartate(D-aspartate) O-methyltransferase [Paraburkholderia sediminicola]|uniref:protein-L-isoaspartate(D-aspartate) O-methyltransferase n=1 Tax=Paraburkholderia sediminicola TaxID=458836 RepID=UPI0038B9AFBD
MREDFAEPRETMIDRQLVARGIAEPRILDAMRRVPREAFLSPDLREFAYADAALPIEAGQTITQPFIVALMLEAARLEPDDRVLEIGTGSGYAAAVLAEMVAHVDTVERHPQLAESARDRLNTLGYDNVNVYAADGTLGLPERAPFDAIVATASGPGVPPAWSAQLEIGGRLVMPVGPDPEHQQLIRLTRDSSTIYREEILDLVRFVPLIGAQGWSDIEGQGGGSAQAQTSSGSPEKDTSDASVREQAAAPAYTQDPNAILPRAAEAAGSRQPQQRMRTPSASELTQLLRDAAEPLPEVDSPDFAESFDRFADHRVVLLGESTHGTSEFYRARAAITRRLVELHGFTIVAIEADWPDAAVIDRHVRHREAPLRASPAFRRFPAWMWRNVEMAAFIHWLHTHNRSMPRRRRAGFYGLDLYSLCASIAGVLDYLDGVDPDAARTARERYGCLTPWQKDPAAYGRAVTDQRYLECEAAVVAQLQSLLAHQLDYMSLDGERFLDAAQNARLIRAAEHYYRAMYYGTTQSWNLRDTHMFDTLTHLLDANGRDAGAVVWAHNSHIGNAAGTEMGRVRDELSLGQLCRERFGDAAALIGFSTHTGSVAAAPAWDAEVEIMQLLPPRENTYEHQMHLAAVPRCMIDLRHDRHNALRARLREERLERFVGVIYQPLTEWSSHYARVSLPDQFDTFVWFDETHAVTPLEAASLSGPDDTWPFGF